MSTQDPLDAPGAASGPSRQAAPPGAHRVLVVDDEPAVRYLLEATLRDWGHQASSADGAAGALRALEAEPFDLVLTDLRMPGVDGLELARRIRERFPRIIVIVMTGYGSVDSAAAAVRLGAFDYLMKPFEDLALVRASVERALEKLRLGAALERSVADLGASRERFEGIVERSSDGILIVDQGGIVRFSNAAARTLLRRTPHPLLGSSFGASLRVGDTAELDIELDDGSTGTAELRVDETDWEGRPALLVTVRDVTARQHAERELRDAHRRLQDADRLKRHFLAMASHDLHAPVHIVLGALDAVLSGQHGELQPEPRRLLHLARSSAQRQGRLVNDLLELSRFDEGGITLRPEPLDLRTVVHQALQESELLPLRQTLAIELELPDAPCNVLGDSDRLVQLVTNLVSNAFRFAATAVRVALIRTGAEARIEVCDDGPGIPPQERERVFERFVRLQTGRGGAGAGLGLSIVRAIAQLHGGCVRVEDHARPDGAISGARFVVQLPAQNGA